MNVNFYTVPVCTLARGPVKDEDLEAELAEENSISSQQTDVLLRRVHM